MSQSDRPAGGPAPRKRVNRREEILRAATDAFAAQGFNNTSLADIAAGLGVTPAGVLHHFGSKTDLLTAVLERRDSDDPPPAGGGMLDHLVATAQRNAEQPGTTRLYAVLSAESATAGHPAQDWFRSRYEGLRADVERALLDRLGLPAADGVPADVRDAAAAIIAVMDGMQVQWLLAPDSVDMAGATRAVIESVVDRLAAARSAPDCGA